MDSGLLVDVGVDSTGGCSGVLASILTIGGGSGAGASVFATGWRSGT